MASVVTKEILNLLCLDHLVRGEINNRVIKENLNSGIKK